MGFAAKARCIALMLVATVALAGSIVGAGLYLGADGITGVAAFWTGLLTLALIVLYYQQSKILDRQTRWMKRRHESAVAVRPPLVADGDTVYVEVENGGPGAVITMRLKTELVDPEVDGLGIRSGAYQLRTPRANDTKLSPYSERRWFEATTRLEIHDSKDARRYPFRFLSSRLREAGVEECTLRFTLEIVDEARFDDAPEQLPLGEQKVQLNDAKTTEIPGGEDGPRKVEFYPPTSLEEGLPPNWPQTVLPMDSPLVIDELSRKRLTEEIEPRDETPS